MEEAGHKAINANNPEAGKDPQPPATKETGTSTPSKTVLSEVTHDLYNSTFKGLILLDLVSII